MESKSKSNFPENTESNSKSLFPLNMKDTKLNQYHRFVYSIMSDSKYDLFDSHSVKEILQEISLNRPGIANGKSTHRITKTKTIQPNELNAILEKVFTSNIRQAHNPNDHQLTEFCRSQVHQVVTTARQTIERYTRIRAGINGVIQYMEKYIATIVQCSPKFEILNLSVPSIVKSSISKCDNEILSLDANIYALDCQVANVIGQGIDIEQYTMCLQNTIKTYNSLERLIIDFSLNLRIVKESFYSLMKFMGLSDIEIEFRYGSIIKESAEYTKHGIKAILFNL